MIEYEKIKEEAMKKVEESNRLDYYRATENPDAAYKFLDKIIKENKESLKRAQTGTDLRRNLVSTFDNNYKRYRQLKKWIESETTLSSPLYKELYEAELELLKAYPYIVFLTFDETLEIAKEL